MVSAPAHVYLWGDACKVTPEVCWMLMCMNSLFPLLGAGPAEPRVWFGFVLVCVHHQTSMKARKGLNDTDFTK